MKYRDEVNIVDIVQRPEVGTGKAESRKTITSEKVYQSVTYLPTD